MNSPLETYLEELGKGIKALPIHERLEQIDETRAHLEGLKASYKELGTVDTLEAEAQAVAQFGSVQSVAQELIKNHQPRPILWQTVSIAAIFWVVAVHTTLLCLMIRPCFPAVLNDLVGVREWSLNDLYLSDESQIMAKIGLLLLSFIPGLMSGAICRTIAPRKTLRPMLLVVSMYLVILGIEALEALRPHTSQGTVPTITYSPFVYPFQMALMFLASGAVSEMFKVIQKVRRVLA
jgi:hypothetical protein